MCENVSKILDITSQLLNETIIGERFVNFEKPLELDEEEFQVLIEEIIDDPNRHIWFYGLNNNDRDDIFIFDIAREIKRIVIESEKVNDKFLVKFIELIRYPR